MELDVFLTDFCCVLQDLSCPHSMLVACDEVKQQFTRTRKITRKCSIFGIRHLIF